MPFPINLIIVHPERETCDAFAERFAGLPNVDVQQRRFEHLAPLDCFVTAGNSYGIMTAGIDAAVVGFHGEELMHRVQDRIRNEYLGEQPVGTAFIEPTGNAAYPYIAHAPTMRTPGVIAGTDKVYCAAWAALLAVYRHNVAVEQRSLLEQRSLAEEPNGAGAEPPDADVDHTAADRQGASAGRRIASVGFPAMGTGFGGLAPAEAARQMAAAYRHYLNPPYRFDWDLVIAREIAINRKQD